MHKFQNFDTHLTSLVGKRDQQSEARAKEDEALEELQRRERNLLSTQGELRTNRKVSASVRIY
jgi:DNA repair protein RAD50